MKARKLRSMRRWIRVEGLEGRPLMTLVGPPTVTSVATASSASTSDTSPLSTFFAKFNATTTSAQANAAIQAVGGTIAQTYPDGTDLIQVANAADASSAVKQLSVSPLVSYAQTDNIIKKDSVVVPNEATFPYSWGLSNPNGVDIDATDAWGVTTGNIYTIVAVLDTGIDLSNPDMASRIWTNPYNDAASGYPNDIHGWNFVSNNNNVQDDNGHGTFVSSILGASGNNGYGIAGVAWNVQIMPVKFLDSNGVGTTDRAVSAIYYAVNHGAKVINASWGGLD